MTRSRKNERKQSKKAKRSHNTSVGEGASSPSVVIVNGPLQVAEERNTSSAADESREVIRSTPLANAHSASQDHTMSYTSRPELCEETLLDIDLFEAMAEDGLSVFLKADDVPGLQNLLGWIFCQNPAFGPLSSQARYTTYAEHRITVSRKLMDHACCGTQDLLHFNPLEVKAISEMLVWFRDAEESSILIEPTEHRNHENNQASRHHSNSTTGKTGLGRGSVDLTKKETGAPVTVEKVQPSMADDYKDLSEFVEESTPTKHQIMEEEPSSVIYSIRGICQDRDMALQENERLQQEITALKSERQELWQQVENNKSNDKKQEQLLATKEAELAMKDKELKEKDFRVQDAEQEGRKLRHELKTSTKALEKERTSKIKIENENLALKQDMTCLQADFKATKDALEMSEREASTAKVRIESMSVDMETLRQERDDYRGPALSLRTNLVQEKDRISKAVAQALAPKDELLKEKDSKIEHLNNLIQELVIGNDHFKRKYRDLEKKNEELEQGNLALEKENQALEDRVRHLKDTLRQVVVNLEQTRAVCNDIDNEL